MHKLETVEFACPVCDHATMKAFLGIDNVPAHIGVLWESRDEALSCPTGRIDLCYCPRCGFVYNTSFSPQLMEYSGGYDNALDFSPMFQDYSRSLAIDLIDRHDLHGKDILEIGSGKGEFLRLICEQGKNRGAGFDPSYEADETEQSPSVTFIKDVFSAKYADQPADLIVCRQVFEHIEDPHSFLTEIRSIIGDRGTPVFFELPDLRNQLEQFSIWAIIYEHCSYFSWESLRAVFSRCGFDVLETPQLFEGLFVGVHAVPSDIVKPSVENLDELGRHIESFSETFHGILARWRDRFKAMAAAGQSAVVWGAGARGTSFVNLLDTQRQVKYLVDINPRKRGKFLAGGGQEIIEPTQLAAIDPDVVIVMNPIYLDEIRKTIEAIGITPEFISA